MRSFKLSLAALLCCGLFALNACQDDEDMSPCGSCDDSDPCTMDECINGQCVNTPDPACSCSAASFPFLVVGHELVYYYGPSLFGGEDTVTLSVNSALGDGNYEINIVAMNTALLNGTAYYYACNDTMYSDNSPVMLPTTWFLHTHLNVGDSWTRGNTGSGEAVEHQLLSKTESLTLPAGTFNNVWQLTYHQDQTFNTDTIWWRHDIGYIKYAGLLDYHLISKNF